MVKFQAVIQKFHEMGEKTGWSYIEISSALINKINPGVKRSFRVKGMLDKHPLKAMALLPMGEGNFILPLRSEIRKAIGKEKGEKVSVTLEVDNDQIPLNEELLLCLSDDSGAFSFFNSLTPSHQRYFSNWVSSAKTLETKSKRIALCLNALANKLDYGQMIRANKKSSADL